nr:DNA mismatch endonuclease Vsr [uncultured Caulobacter sp.]
MSRVSSRNTSPEMAVRRALHRAGLRFRLHEANMPGRPDIVLPRWKTVIFVHGCFWHRHADCRYASIPKTRTALWLEKFERNVARDAVNRRKAEEMGWRVLEVWECDVKKDRFKEPLLAHFQSVSCPNRHRRVSAPSR